jgi:hypothetical protein
MELWGGTQLYLERLAGWGDRGGLGTGVTWLPPAAPTSPAAAPAALAPAHHVRLALPYDGPERLTKPWFGRVQP